jgi:hypothetical protein
LFKDDPSGFFCAAAARLARARVFI